MSAFSIRPTLFRRLIRKFGQNDAKRQLQWLKKEWLLLEKQQRPSLAGQIGRLLRDEPLAYVIGNQPFGPLNLRVTPPVLIPRPETEEWTYELLDRLSKTKSETKEWKILDMCTGSGCIPLLLCNEWPSHLGEEVSAYGIDIGDEAISLAQENSRRVLKDSIASPSFKPMKFDVFSKGFAQWISDTGPFDVVTSNPPYIPEKDWDSLPAAVKYEDRRALEGGKDGLIFYRQIAELLTKTPLLRLGGWLAVEFGIHQAEDVRAILEGSGVLDQVDIWTDCFGVQRVAFCRKRIA
ncbi:hypothetical protein M408DRAFT_19607 [Serendipita vermifera MAFF 305830]|uniref:DNA methylase adenine-specific domain-containing protein n=1 Tax=Serendipita vermifera MAFF 305830 TaxID=933852 RepID=A0A0C3BMF7_SERVB|nr:hypothetical protein M408DRAFT_19607 [Serendipita vermifera MAFF 305830]